MNVERQQTKFLDPLCSDISIKALQKSLLSNLDAVLLSFDHVSRITVAAKVAGDYWGGFAFPHSSLIRDDGGAARRPLPTTPKARTFYSFYVNELALLRLRICFLHGRIGQFFRQEISGNAFFGAAHVDGRQGDLWEPSCILYLLACESANKLALGMTSATMIGTAFLRAIDDESAGGTKDRVSAARDDRVLPEAPVRPCILNTISDDIVHPILLSGPEGSGKSSILLDLACTLAAQTPCRCNDTPCRCNAVLFLSPLAMKESFPLFCHPWSDQENSQDSRLDKNLLNRIRIHHVATLHEIYTILLSLQGLHVTHQPWGGILIDNLDFWVKDQSVLTTQLGESVACAKPLLISAKPSPL